MTGSAETKDFDLMVRPCDVGGALQLCRSAGYAVPSWRSAIGSQLGEVDSFLDGRLGGRSAMTVEEIKSGLWRAQRSSGTGN